MGATVMAATLLCLLMTSCASRGEVEGGTNTVCVETLRFADEDQRTAFLDGNADQIIGRAAIDALFLVPDLANPALEISAAQTCPSQGLAIAHGLLGSFQSANHQVATDDMRRRLELVLASNMRGTESDIHRCIVRTDELKLDQFGLMYRRLWFSGLRGVHLEGADGVIYVAAAESCALLVRFASAALKDLDVAEPQVTPCGETSFRGCGYPNNTTFGR